MLELFFIIIAAIFIGLSLGLLGSGGAILTTPALTYIVGQDEKTAIASSLAIVGLISFSGMLKYQQQKMIQWPVVLQFGIPSMLASYISAGLSVYLTGPEQLTLFAVIMLLSAASMLKPKADIAHEKLESHSALKLVIIGVVVGSITGLVGVGGGFLIVPALLFFTRMNMLNAVATSLSIITLQSTSGFINYYSLASVNNINFDWQVIAIFAFIGAISSLFGHKISSNISQEKLKKTFALLLFLMAIFILINSSRGLF
ncbi:sulfite exporter TauE/SafE family protein [Thalassotalea profundi]|uniref:Probable membrane transporter protein n=1 Tax=Thalassotalea profundi TaxID=2036687 RepID=A0ABQ3IB98_9GAMM|nr:sulfite exporter TauE/SafE family protein [Thalassotalea profundi]GHE77780.1 UPF0721 transmembrane protein [Thalassotalea profundi]